MIYRELSDRASDARDSMVKDTNLTATDALCQHMYKKFGYSFAATNPAAVVAGNEEVAPCCI